MLCLYVAETTTKCPSMGGVAYWVNTAIKRGTQENETKMAEQPVFNQIARPCVIPNMERPKWHTGYPI